MKNGDPSPELIKATRDTATQAASKINTTLEAIRAKATQARDLENRKADLEEALKTANADLAILYTKTLPTMLIDAGVDRIGVPAAGNLPAVDYVLRSHYAANIAAAWAPEKKEAAFKVLIKLKAGDLIKSEVVTRLPRGNVGRAKVLVAAIKKLCKQAEIEGAGVDLKKTVPHTTLGAWLREIYEDKGQQLSATDLESIGGYVGRIVKAEERKV